MHSPPTPPADRYLMPLAAFALIAGIFVRFWDLGGAPLAVDEYYTGTSILNILQRGLPEFACGGFYPRGLITQYLAVPLLHFGGSLEFSVRFWPAVASVLTIFGVWRIARMAGGPTVASIAVILTSLSLWEIEFGRFGRMYAPFQAMFVWYVYFQLRHLVDGRDGAKWAYLGISALSIPEFSGAAFLLIFNFLPLVWRGKKCTFSHLAAAALVLVLGVIFHRTDFRAVGVVPELPSDASPLSAVAAAMVLPIERPPLPDSLLPILICGLVIFGFAVFRFRQYLFFRHPAVIFWILATVCLGFGLIGFGIPLIIAGLFLNLPLPAREKGLGPQPWLALLFLLLMIWAVVLTISFWLGGADLSSTVKGTRHYLFEYPDFYFWVLRPWLRAIPATTIAMIALTIPVIWAVLRSPRNVPESDTAVLRYLLGAVILLLLLAALFWKPSSNTRYTYFLYPLVTVLAAAGIGVVTARFRNDHRGYVLVPVALIGALFLVTEDYSIRHMININEPEYRFRTAYDFERGMHYYFRWDFRGASEYVNSNLRRGDTVITFADVLPHYLDRTDGAFQREGTVHHEGVWACNGTRHVWSNAPLLDREIEVQQLIENTTGRVWMIMRTPTVIYHDPLESALVQRYQLQPVFKSQDGYLEVYRIDTGRSN